MSIEEDVKRCKELIKIEHANWIGMSNQSAISNVLAELEQDKKRIQELEEESRKKSIELICYQEELENSILKQVVIDKIEDLKTKRRELCFKTYLKREDMLNDDRIIVCGIQILQELLETK